jgi:plastocyanin
MQPATPSPADQELTVRHPMTSHRGGLAAAAVLAFVSTLTACDTDAPGDDGPPAADQEEVAEDPSDDSAAMEPEVATRDLEFDPATLTVPAGTTVTWTNEDPVDHTVTSGAAGEPDGDFDEPLDAEGGSVELDLDEQGTIIYHCTIHPDMVGRIEVQ